MAWRGGRVQRDQADEVDKIQHVERRGEAGRSAGGHDVAGAGDVIAQHLEGVLADKDAARAGDAARPARKGSRTARQRCSGA